MPKTQARRKREQSLMTSAEYLGRPLLSDVRKLVIALQRAHRREDLIRRECLAQRASDPTGARTFAQGVLALLDYDEPKEPKRAGEHLAP